jgi:hypothetical protein
LTEFNEILHAARLDVLTRAIKPQGLVDSEKSTIRFLQFGQRWILLRISLTFQCCTAPLSKSCLRSSLQIAPRPFSACPNLGELPACLSANQQKRHFIRFSFLEASFLALRLSSFNPKDDANSTHK